jgi:1-acyl-sn-glycerol-3-phosphate acyltransferase
VIKSQEELWDMSADGNDASNRMSHVVGNIVASIVAVLMKILFRFSVENRQTILQFNGKKTGAVVIAPHQSYMDVVMMYLASWPKRWTRIIARESLFTAAHGLLGFVIARVGSFPVKRDTADMSAVKRASRFLKNGEIIGIFPEGTRRGKGNSVPAIHGGAGLIARLGKAPLIPLGLKNVDQVKPKGKRLHFPKLTAVYGTPVSLSSFDFLPKEERLEAATWYVLREAFALSRDVAPLEVNMAALFPESKDYTEVFIAHEIAPFDPSSLPDYKPPQLKE